MLRCLFNWAVFFVMVFLVLSISYNIAKPHKDIMETDYNYFHRTLLENSNMKGI
jgi:hypothetical protein